MKASFLSRDQAAIVWLTFVAGSAACTSPTGPDELSGVTLQAASVRSSAVPPGATFPPTIRVEGRNVVVSGIITTPCLGYAISAGALKLGSLVTITLTARQLGNVCLTLVDEFAYRATVPLWRGAYRIDVVYEYPGTSLPTEVVGKATIVVK